MRRFICRPLLFTCNAPSGDFQLFFHGNPQLHSVKRYINKILFSLAVLSGAVLSGCASSPSADPLPEVYEAEEEAANNKTDNTDSAAYEITESNIDRYELSIAGISREYNFLFLTDSHITISDDTDSQEVRDYSAERLSQFTDESGIASCRKLDSFIDFANEEQIDGLLLGGDIIDFPSAKNIDFLSSSIKRLKTPYLYTLGNHDWTYPWEYMTEKGTAEYLPLLSPYIQENPAIHTQEFEDFTVAAIDNSSNQINPAVLEEYKKILSAGKPVILLLHVPLYTEALLTKTSQEWAGSVVLGGGVHGGIYPNDISAEFINLTTAKDSPVFLVLAGHVHIADKSDILGDKNVPQITGDAVFKGKAAMIQIKGI